MSGERFEGGRESACQLGALETERQLNAFESQILDRRREKKDLTEEEVRDLKNDESARHHKDSMIFAL